MNKPCGQCGAGFEAGSCEKYCSARCMILARVVADESGCWLWGGSVNSDGYGSVGWRGRSGLKAHRVAYEVFVGPINGQVVCHRCDVRRCCNPEHLFVGTQLENIEDCKRKRRHTHGVKQSKAKLSEEQVRQIRLLAGPTVQLAKRFGVSRATIRRVVRGDFWKHVD